MRVATWLKRLNIELPGWKVWHASGSGYYAAPAPADTALADVVQLANRIGPYPHPATIRLRCRERYGWEDYCDTCGVLARECGHRQDETKERP